MRAVQGRWALQRVLQQLQGPAKAGIVDQGSTAAVRALIGCLHLLEDGQAPHSGRQPAGLSWAADGARSLHARATEVWGRAGPPAHSSARPCLWDSPRSFASQVPPARPAKRHVLYRGPWLLPVRLLVRMKLIQLSWVAVLALPVHSLITEVRLCLRRAPRKAGSCSRKTCSSAQGTASFAQVATTAALLGGCGVASTALFYFSRRYVGELALLPNAGAGGSLDTTRVLVSTLDFWGNRQVRPYAGWPLRRCLICDKCDAATAHRTRRWGWAPSSRRSRAGRRTCGSWPCSRSCRWTWTGTASTSSPCAMGPCWTGPGCCSCLRGRQSPPDSARHLPYICDTPSRWASWIVQTACGPPVTRLTAPEYNKLASWQAESVRLPAVRLRLPHACGAQPQIVHDLAQVCLGAIQASLRPAKPLARAHRRAAALALQHWLRGVRCRPGRSLERGRPRLWLGAAGAGAGAGVRLGLGHAAPRAGTLQALG